MLVGQRGQAARKHEQQIQRRRGGGTRQREGAPSQRTSQT